VSADGERLDGVRQCARAADLDDAIGAFAAGESADFLVPIRRLDIIDDRGGAERLEPFGLCGGRGRRDHLGAEQPGELQREDRHAAGTLSQHGVSSHNPAMAGEGHPGGHRRAG